MIRLAIDTALANCSAALFDGDRLLAAADEIIGRGHAERLVPMIGALLAEAGVARADELLVDVGPGSFTGIRVGVAAARALGLAWGARVSGYRSTMLVGAGAFARDPALPSVFVALEAGRGELYVQRIEADGSAGELAAMSPPEAAELAKYLAVAGSGAATLALFESSLAIIGPDWPSARDVLRLREEQRALPPRPLYVRAPDASLPA